MADSGHARCCGFSMPLTRGRCAAIFLYDNAVTRVWMGLSELCTGEDVTHGKSGRELDGCAGNKRAALGTERMIGGRGTLRRLTRSTRNVARRFVRSGTSARDATDEDGKLAAGEDGGLS